jgi:hypothetical protein
MKILEVSFKTFSFKDNVIILLCNKKVKRKKILWTLVFKILMVFKLSYSSSKILID